MGKFDTSDLDIDGQITIDQYLDKDKQLFAVSNIFAHARKKMSLAEQKTFVYALTEVRFKEEATTLAVKLDKKRLAAILGLNSDPDHLSGDIYDNIKQLPEHSHITISDRDIDLYSNGFVITSVTRFKNIVRVRFNEDYIGLFTGLTSNYITMWSTDIFKMTSKRTVIFYEYLRSHMDSDGDGHSVRISVKKFKELFDMPKEGEGSYVRNNGHFDRPAFECRVIDPLCEDMKHCRMIQLVVQPDGRYYVKEKQGNRVSGYRFFWTFSKYPGISSAEEVHEIREAVDADPQVLKVAKDIVDGKKKSGKKKNTFTDFDQRQIDFEELERRLIRQEPGKS